MGSSNLQSSNLMPPNCATGKESPCRAIHCHGCAAQRGHWMAEPGAHLLHEPWPESSVRFQGGQYTPFLRSSTRFTRLSIVGSASSSV